MEHVVTIYNILGMRKSSVAHSIFEYSRERQNVVFEFSCPSTRHEGAWGRGGIAPTHS
jgi:hypothetical protein